MDSFKRTLTLKNSVFLGLSSMIGAGLFVNIAPTAVISSYSLILGLVIASFLAFANASSSAQLARVFPETGGTYLYARKVFGKQCITIFWHSVYCRKDYKFDCDYINFWKLSYAIVSKNIWSYVSFASWNNKLLWSNENCIRSKMVCLLSNWNIDVLHIFHYNFN